MQRPSMSEILKDKESYYSLVVAVAKRARTISDDAQTSGEILLQKPVQLAVDDFASGRYKLVEQRNIGQSIE